MMRYFRVKNSRNRKIVGFPYQTNGYISGYDVKSPNSRTNLNYDEFPDFVPDLRFELHEKSKLTDVVDASNISAIGFLVNEKVKCIFDEFNFPTHRYYNASILDHKGNVLPYYWMHIISNGYSLVDFEKSVFRKSSFPLKVTATKSDEKIWVEDIEDLRTQKINLFKEDKYIVADILEINNFPKYDVLHFRDICGFVYISEVLVNKINENKITGFDIVEDFDFKVSL